MLRSIVVPLDGSKLSEQALPVALGLVARSGGALHLVYADAPPVSLDLMPGVPAPDVQVTVGVVAAMERWLEEIAQTLRRRHRVQADATVREGRPADVIARFSREVAADLIVLTTHGRGGLSRMWLGSVADDLLRAAEVPILAVRPARRGAGLVRQRRFRHLLVTLDGSVPAEHALGPALAVARASQARVTLLRVVTSHLAVARPAPVTRVNRADLARQREQADRYLRAVARRLRHEVSSIRGRVMVAPDAARGILRSAVALRADLIAMTTHAGGVVARFFRGSVSDKVLRTATRTAVLITPPRAGEPASSGRALPLRPDQQLQGSR